MRFLILAFCFYVAHATVVVAPPKCPCNEVYSACKDPCPVTCNAITTGEPGPDCVRPNPCKGGCNCADGYVRNHLNKCILENDCPCPSSNATLVDCPNPCPRTCDNLQQGGVIPCGRMCIRKGCTCKDGFVQDADGNCIKPEDCPQDCPANEEWNSCPGFCNFEEDCMYVFGARRSCILPPPGVKIPCQPQCRCKAGFVRIADGTCASADKCCDAPSSLLTSCPAPCERTCSFYPESEPDCKEDCSMNKCICAPTFVRNEGKCIPENDCPCADPNSVYQYYPPPCPPTCDFPDGRTPCPEYEAGFIAGLARGCICKEGFVRDANGICITPDKCPKKCPANEVLNSSPKACVFEPDCLSVFGIVPACSLPLKPVPIKPRCECKEGLVRQNGMCVSPAKCCTVPNTKLVNCPAPSEATCSKSPVAGSKDACKGKKCVCNDGYVREGLKCILKKNCPPKCSKPNEEYLECGSPCQATCENREPMCKAKCGPGCFCKKGYVRNNGNCIPIKQCKPCTPVPKC